LEDDAVSGITFPQAKDDECVYSYMVSIDGSDGSHLGYRYTSGYFVEPMPKTLTVNLRSELKRGVTYTVRITPVDGFGNVGSELTVEFTNAS
jgi:hypothetical protein